MSDINDIRRGIGDDWPITLEVTTDGRTPADLTGYTSTLYVYDTQDVEGATPLFSISGDMTNSATGVVTYAPTDQQVAGGIDAYYRAKIVNGSDQELTVKRGVFVYD